jgi:hypothetical protein
MEYEFIAFGSSRQRGRMAEEFIIGYKAVATTDTNYFFVL